MGRSLFLLLIPLALASDDWYNAKDLSVLPGTLIPRRLESADAAASGCTKRGGLPTPCNAQTDTCASAKCKNQFLGNPFVCCHQKCKCTDIFSCRCVNPGGRGLAIGAKYGRWNHNMATYRSCKCMAGWPHFGFGCFQGKTLFGQTVTRQVTVCPKAAVVPTPPPTYKPILVAPPKKACPCNKATHTCVWGCMIYKGKCIMWVPPVRQL